MSEKQRTIYMIYREVRKERGGRIDSLHYQTAHQTLEGAKVRVGNLISRMNFPNAVVVSWDDSPPLYIAYHNGKRSEYYITVDILRD